MTAGLSPLLVRVKVQVTGPSSRRMSPKLWMVLSNSRLLPTLTWAAAVVARRKAARSIPIIYIYFFILLSEFIYILFEFIFTFRSKYSNK